LIFTRLGNCNDGCFIAADAEAANRIPETNSGSTSISMKAWNAHYQ